MRRLATLTAVAAALLAVAAPAALAGTPFTIGSGKDPHLVVDRTGTAHVVWTDSATDTVHYCQVPRGERACALERELDAGTEPGRPYLVQGTGALYIAMPHYARDATYLWTSTDGGTTWSQLRRIYSFGRVAESTEPVLSPQSGEIAFGGWNPKVAVWSAAVDGSEAGRGQHVELAGGEGRFYGQVARTQDGSLIATADTGAASPNALYWELFPESDAGDPLNWSGETPIGPGGDARVAGGPGGTYLLTGVTGRQTVRRFDETGFGRGTTVEPETGYVNDITVSGSGGVGAIWRRNRLVNQLRLALSRDRGKTFSTATIARDDTVMLDMDLALADDDRGFATYEGSSDGDRAHSQIRLASTAPVGGGTTAKRTRMKTATVKGATLTLRGPGRCVRAASRFTARLTSRKRRGSGFVRVVRTAFSVGGAKPRADRRAPFTQRLKVRRPKAGKIYTLEAVVSIALKRHKKATTTLQMPISVCA